MNETPPAKDKDVRKARLAEQLRANLMKRKQQARSRRSGPAAATPEPGEPDATDGDVRPSGLAQDREAE